MSQLNHPGIKIINPETAIFSYPSDIPPVAPASSHLQTIQQAPNATPKEYNTNRYVIKPVRTISKHIIYKDVNRTIPADWSHRNILKDSLKIMPPTLTVFKDHCWSVEQAVGHARDFQWNDTTTPEGIDANILISRVAKNSQDIAIHVEDGSINCVSMTLIAKYSLSHDMDPEVFRKKLGQEVDGHLVRYIMQEILRHYELSLVWTGADHSAHVLTQKLNHYAQQYQNQQPAIVSMASTQPVQKPKTPIQEETTMDPQLQQVYTLVTEKFNRSVVTTQQLEQFLTTLAAEKTALETQVNTLNGQVNELTPYKHKVTQLHAAQVEKLTQLKKVISGNQELDTLTLKVIQQSSIDELYTMIQEQKTQLEQSIPQKCNQCGSTDINRTSSLSPEKGNPVEPPTHQTVKKLKPLGFEMEKK